MAVTSVVFDDGSQAWNNMVAPHGTGRVGLYFVPAASTASSRLQSMDRLIDYFL